MSAPYLPFFRDTPGSPSCLSAPLPQTKAIPKPDDKIDQPYRRYGTKAEQHQVDEAESHYHKNEKDNFRGSQTGREESYFEQVSKHNDCANRRRNLVKQ
ncbi:hypothetical protein [Paraburkholderia ginsengisoli]|uniref:Uncharacterized protein n=1 Tax=Paraburkholderia ginsengisoli TaxID=311231 RepID=A0A7T4N9Y0_9BURK|nr:hypothetical protein [Paraburkholderia ginsengisoli]QQC67942.1 hypothetical protein I6I06_28580 [Paraburkholderia ginsengisoli]